MRLRVEINIATGATALGATLMGISVAPEPASPLLFIVGAILVGGGAGWFFGIGINQVQESPSSTTPSGASSDNTSVPQPDGDSVDIPDGEIYGDPPTGVNSDQLIATIVNNFDLVPDGWDLNTGSGLPGFPGGSDDGGLGGGGLGGGLGGGAGGGFGGSGEG